MTPPTDLPPQAFRAALAGLLGMGPVRLTAVRDVVPLTVVMAAVNLPQGDLPAGAGGGVPAGLPGMGSVRLTGVVG
jgi:hypothetical protein